MHMDFGFEKRTGECDFHHDVSNRSIWRRTKGVESLITPLLLIISCCLFCFTIVFVKNQFRMYQRIIYLTEFLALRFDVCFQNVRLCLYVGNLRPCSSPVS